MKKSLIKCIVALALVIVSVFAMSSVALAEYNTMYINCPVGETVRLREGPGTSYDVVIKIPYGTAVQAEYYNSSWYKVKYNNYSGYMMAEFLSSTRPSADQDTFGYTKYLGGTGSSENLIKGSTGPRVKNLQLMLNFLKYNCGTADGIFGSATLTAVKNFQRFYGLSVDGIVGKDTKAEIWRLLDGTIPDGCVQVND